MARSDWAEELGHEQSVELLETTMKEETTDEALSGSRKA